MLGSVVDHIDMVEDLELGSASVAFESGNSARMAAQAVEDSSPCMDFVAAKVAAEHASADYTAYHTLAACEDIALEQAKIGTTSHAESLQTCHIRFAVEASNSVELVVGSMPRWPTGWLADRCIVDSLLISFGQGSWSVGIDYSAVPQRSDTRKNSE